MITLADIVVRILLCVTGGAVVLFFTLLFLNSRLSRSVEDGYRREDARNAKLRAKAREWEDREEQYAVAESTPLPQPALSLRRVEHRRPANIEQFG